MRKIVLFFIILLLLVIAILFLFETSSAKRQDPYLTSCQIKATINYTKEYMSLCESSTGSYKCDLGKKINSQLLSQRKYDEDYCVAALVAATSR